MQVLLDGDYAFRTGEVGDRMYFLKTGFVQITGDKVTILSDVSEQKDNIDVARAQSSLERADAALASDSDDIEAAQAKRRAEVRLGVADGSLPAV